MDVQVVPHDDHALASIASRHGLHEVRQCRSVALVDNLGRDLTRHDVQRREQVSDAMAMRDVEAVLVVGSTTRQ